MRLAHVGLKFEIFLKFMYNIYIKLKKILRARQTDKPQVS